MSLQKNKTFLKAGFTLLELLIVLSILALFAALAGPQLIKYLSKAKAETAQVQVNNLISAVELYYLDTGRYPSKEGGLAALLKDPGNVPRWNGPYLKKQDGLTDPWDHSYQYRHPGQHGDFDIYSFGRDNAEGGEGEDKDITSW
ncbi:MAG: type II secretion system major pseudopilin GspG [Pseudomonadota bacterium]